MRVSCNQCGWSVDDYSALCPRCQHLIMTRPAVIPHPCSKCERTHVVEAISGKCVACGYYNYVKEMRNDE